MKTNLKYNIELDKTQIFNLISQLNVDDKIELINNLQESTFIKRFEKLLDSLKTSDLTYEDITKEVEIVRNKRFKEGKHNA
ncbi:MAG: hypothetical protein COZ21_07920 [Bacteroidetes bacterium CG_4_10_14_3_um_filter_31_20]|nr:MAG: hypothetical protein COZ21_07920 [Bacteroidetes bacterium CG_4_10_14_3_um_filter_31_20]